MLFVFVLGLAALAVAEPVYNQEGELIDENIEPTIQHREKRFLPLYEDMKDNYPFQPYSNVESYPYRSNYFLRYLNSLRPEMSEHQPMIEYDSQDKIHQYDINHHHIYNNVHNFQQRNIIRNFDQKVPYFPYYPTHYNKMNTHNFVQNTPYIPYSPNYYYKLNIEQPNMSNQYSKNLGQEYIQPWTNNYFNWQSVIGYLRNHYGDMNTEITMPNTYRTMGGRNMNVNYKTQKFVSAYPVRMQQQTPLIATAPAQKVFPSQIIQNYVHPVTMQGKTLIEMPLETVHTQKVVSTPNFQNYAHSGRMQQENPLIARQLDIVPTQKVLSTSNVENYGHPIRMQQMTPLTTMRRNNALIEETPAMSEGRMEEGRSQNIQLNSEATFQPEDHIAQLPIHRVAKDLEDVQYTVLPYYRYPYYRSYVQSAPQVTRSTFYPNQYSLYNLLFKK